MAVLAAITATVCLVIVQNTRDFIPYWARYNYTGYESGTTADFTAKSWPEYRAFLDTANSLPPGRMLWEGGDAIGAYGTPLALMLLPYWTHGRIQSMEGLYFEASTTTPYHFMTVATLAQSPSNPVRGLPYKSIADFDLGVKYLQLMGVRYYAAFSTEAKDKANANPNLQVVATVPDLDGKPPSGWNIYRVKDSPTVQALPYQPVVATGMQSEPSWKCEGVPKLADTGGTQAEFSPWECSAVPWFSDPNALDRPITDDGPASWTRAPAAKAPRAAKQALPPVDVSNIHTTESSIEFDVSRTGVPVMVKTSWYPNWQAEGRKWSVAGDPQLHGGGAHEQAREADVHHRHRRLGGAGADGGGSRRARRAGVVGDGGPQTGRTCRRERRRKPGFTAAAGTIPVPLSAVRTRGSSARLCARLHLQGL